MAIDIVPIAEAHIEGFHACLDTVARERRYLAQIEAPPMERVRDFVRDGLAADVAQFVVLDGGRVVGWCDIFPSWAHALAHTGSLGMGLLPSHRGQGLGERLLRACLARARARGLERVVLEARADNARALRLYERVGFVRVSVEHRAMRFDGVDHDSVRMVWLAPDPTARAAPASDQAAPWRLRAATSADARCLAVLAQQVFLDTYATQGVRPPIADEALSAFAPDTLAALIGRTGTELIVAERDGHLLGFAQVSLGVAQAMVPGGLPATAQAELDRLYVQERFTGQHLGTRLLAEAERRAAARGARVLWLTPWVHNARALAFYRRRGYVDHGATVFRLGDESHENRVLARVLD
ncbi:GNAT family N-acetyltransferase [Ideonella sp. A 288]|uniref:GNAT family N-acetyltransferase n=1 Tax=Ideonella sp. A 288 TaxID=1962181 RepID=UPI0018FEF690|nr:GNAT family N-acetyltransferase [Ideonella sp. A 288]